MAAPAVDRCYGTPVRSSRRRTAPPIKLHVRDRPSAPPRPSVMLHGSPHWRPCPAQASPDRHLTTHMLLVSDGSLPLVHAEFRHRCVDPFAVQLRLSVGPIPGRQLDLRPGPVDPGISHPSGIGDVRIYPGGDGVLIELRSAIDPHAPARSETSCSAGWTAPGPTSPTSTPSASPTFSPTARKTPGVTAPLLHRPRKGHVDVCIPGCLD